MARKSLGRGLEALIQTPQTPPPSGGGAAQLLNVPIDSISASPLQPRTRFDDAGLEELARSINSQGLIEPLVVRPNPEHAEAYQLIAGERRLRAARKAGLAFVPVVVKTLDDQRALEMSLVENLAREELGPIDEARALLRLSTEFGLSHEEKALRIGKSRPYVSNAIRLLDLPAEVVEMVENGKLTAGQARPLLGLDDARMQLETARKIVSGGISARGAEAMVRTSRSPASSSKRQTTEPNLQALNDALQEALKRRVRIVRSKRGSAGRIEIEYYDELDLNALVEFLLGNDQT